MEVIKKMGYYVDLNGTITINRKLASKWDNAKAQKIDALILKKWYGDITTENLNNSGNNELVDKVYGLAEGLLWGEVFAVENEETIRIGGYTKLREDNVLEFLEFITKYKLVEDFCIEYIGEDHASWRYIYDTENNTYKEDTGEVVFDSDFGKIVNYKIDKLMEEGFATKTEKALNDTAKISVTTNKDEPNVVYINIIPKDKNGNYLEDMCYTLSKIEINTDKINFDVYTDTKNVYSTEHSEISMDDIKDFCCV